MATNRVKLSVVIPTYNRSATLAMTLDRLNKQSINVRDYEVLVVDDGSSDATEEVVKQKINAVSYPLRYLVHENKGPGYTQNRGIMQARAGLVLIMADDILASEVLLEQHMSTHLQHPEKEVAVLGKVVQSTLLPQTVFHRNWDPFRFDLLEGKEELPSVCFFGCSISFKKDFLLQYGLFVEKKGAAHEDIELGYRLGKKGLRILYNQQALGFHHHLESLGPACRRSYQRGWNFDLLSNNIPKSYIFPKYSILSTEAGWAAFFKMLPKGLFRSLVFNNLTISYFWFPVLKRSEVNRFAAFLVNSFTLRGTIFYFQRAGYWDKKRNKPYQLKKYLVS